MENSGRAKIIVIDASVATRWFVNEEWADAALKIREEYCKGLIDIVAPYLIVYEISNALRYSPDLGMKDVLESMSAFRDMQLDLLLLDDDLIKRSIETAFTRNITIYDSTYVSLAEHLNVKLVTGDKELHTKVGSSNIVLLPEYDYGKL
jgi:predicted nucleic acid-binding protein